MSDLRQELIEWRQRMLDGGIESAEALDELESHLRDEMDHQVGLGAGAQQAFEFAVAQLGEADVLQGEFVKTGGTLADRLKQILFTLGGIPNYQLATTMKTSNPNIEPAWATYLKGTTFVLPAVGLWLFSVVFLVPKVSEICQAAGTSVFKFGEAPLVVQVAGIVGQGMLFLTQYSLLIAVAILLAIVLLEWRFPGWSRYRRAAVGIGAFLLNTVVLLSITTVIVSIAVAASTLLQHS